MIKTVDLTHPITEGMPVYPGTDPPVLRKECTIEKTGFCEKKIILYSHTGTHMDAPAHLIEGAGTLDTFPVSKFYGGAFILDCTAVQNSTIELKDLEPYHSNIGESEFLLLYTGWSRYWGDEAYFKNYPVMSIEAIRWLTQFKLKGVGLDTISVDRIDTEDFPIHMELLQNNTVIIENLANLDTVPVGSFIFSCFPMSFRDADGSPVRAVAIIS